MKRILIILLMLLVISCTKEINLEENILENTSRIGDKKKDTDKRTIEIYEEKISDNKEVKLFDVSKYSRSDKAVIKLINRYIESGELQNIDRRSLKIINGYTSFQEKSKEYESRVTYIKDKNNYYYLCDQWPLCERVINTYSQTEGILSVIDEYSYMIGSKLYENKYIKAREKGEIELKKNAKLIKDFGDNFVLRQGKGFEFGSNEESIVLYHKEERIWSKEINFYLVRSIDASDQNIIIFSIYDKNDPAYPIGTLVYNIKTTKIFELPYSFIVNVKQGKSGLFFIVHGLNGYSNLRLINIEGDDINIYMGKTDLGKDSEFIKDYELMLDRKLKLLYLQGIEGIERKKIISLP